ncbi:zinc ribbon domain-containing protein [Ruminococcus albus]|uniref:Uncharacterized protein n=1 Tax=Ruminococcus albus (strain ATCC 27210 / DSM 20455 / JCM 14654 / NCDO 2250 / 7) TaxID=697329 RepID=E6UDN0_RUMA7|nr:zinc ribbon domain-containing protein [Ruminococcus albus]ADU20858.1 hypothetical protein Rumal_0301 [Ruminococcus albus 7 = DSM 20455]
MKISCRFCGASVESTDKICPGCGKVMPAFKGAELGRHNQFSSDRERDGLSPSRLVVQTPYAATRSGRQMDKLDEHYGTAKARKEHHPDNYDPRKDNRAVPFSATTGSGKQANRSIISNGLANVIKFILIIIIGMVIYAIGRVLLVSHTNYDFNLDESIKLESSNYGDAFDSYFEECHWWFDFSQNKVTFRGVDKDGKEYNMVFGRAPDGQTAVKELRIDGKKITTEDVDIMNTYIMGMFMTPKDIKHVSMTGKGL